MKQIIYDEVRIWGSMCYNGNGYAPLGIGVLALYFVSQNQSRDIVGRWEALTIHSASRQNGQTWGIGRLIRINVGKIIKLASPPNGV